MRSRVSCGLGTTTTYKHIKRTHHCSYTEVLSSHNISVVTDPTPVTTSYSQDALLSAHLVFMTGLMTQS